MVFEGDYRGYIMENISKKIAIVAVNAEIKLSEVEFSISTRAKGIDNRINCFKKSMIHLSSAIKLLLIVNKEETRKELANLLWNIGESMGEEWVFGSYFMEDKLPSDNDLKKLSKISFLYGRLERGKEHIKRAEEFALLYEKAVEAGINDFYMESFGISLSENVKDNLCWIEQMEKILQEIVESTFLIPANLESCYKNTLLQTSKSVENIRINLEKGEYVMVCKIGKNCSCKSRGSLSNVWKILLDEEIVNKVISQSVSEIDGLWKTFHKDYS